MIHSMTAFARADRSFDGGRVLWELRSVNHRFLETQLRLPESLRDLEFPLRDLVRSRLKRGKLDGTLKIEYLDKAPQLELNRPVLLQLLAAVEQVKRDAPEARYPDPLELLRWPGVLGDAESGNVALRKAATEAFGDALDGLIEHREREGARLAELVRSNLDEIETVVSDLRRQSENQAGEQFARLKARVDELGVSADPGRLEQELALLAQRADVTEELDRLAVHLREGRNMLSAPGPHGRSLDFLMQELNREANTLGAKSVVPESAQRAIDLKVTIERIREQVQNIE